MLRNGESPSRGPGEAPRLGTGTGGGRPLSNTDEDSICVWKPLGCLGGIPDFGAPLKPLAPLDPDLTTPGGLLIAACLLAEGALAWLPPSRRSRSAQAGIRDLCPTSARGGVDAALDVLLGLETADVEYCLMVEDAAELPGVDTAGTCIPDPRGDGDGLREFGIALPTDAARGLVVEERRLETAVPLGRGAGLNDAGDAAARPDWRTLGAELMGEGRADGAAAASIASRVSAGNSKNCSTVRPKGASCAAEGSAPTSPALEARVMRDREDDDAEDAELSPLVSLRNERALGCEVLSVW